MNSKRLLAQVATGHLHNVSFRDFSALVMAFGFREARIEGSHHIFQHNEVVEQLNLQDVVKRSRIRSGSFCGSWSVTIYD